MNFKKGLLQKEKYRRIPFEAINSAKIHYTSKLSK